MKVSVKTFREEIVLTQKKTERCVLGVTSAGKGESSARESNPRHISCFPIALRSLFSGLHSGVSFCKNTSTQHPYGLSSLFERTICRREMEKWPNAKSVITLKASITIQVRVTGGGYSWASCNPYIQLVALKPTCACPS